MRIESSGKHEAPAHAPQGMAGILGKCARRAAMFDFGAGDDTGFSQAAQAVRPADSVRKQTAGISTRLRIVKNGLELTRDSEQKPAFERPLSLMLLPNAPLRPLK